MIIISRHTVSVSRSKSITATRHTRHRIPLFIIHIIITIVILLFLHSFHFHICVYGISQIYCYQYFFIKSAMSDSVCVCVWNDWKKNLQINVLISRYLSACTTKVRTHDSQTTTEGMPLSLSLSLSFSCVSVCCACEFVPIPFKYII